MELRSSIVSKTICFDLYYDISSLFLERKLMSEKMDLH